jgi:hypothetical protein
MGETMKRILLALLASVSLAHADVIWHRIATAVSSGVIVFQSNWENNGRPTGTRESTLQWIKGYQFQRKDKVDELVQTDKSSEVYRLTDGNGNVGLYPDANE